MPKAKKKTKGKIVYLEDTTNANRTITKRIGKLNKGRFSPFPERSRIICRVDIKRDKHVNPTAANRETKGEAPNVQEAYEPCQIEDKHATMVEDKSVGDGTNKENFLGIAIDSLTNEDLKSKLIAKYPDVGESAFEVLVAERVPSSITDHMQQSLSMLKQIETSTDNELKSLLLYASFFHAEIVEKLNKN